jgi:hypothetical protein
MAKATPFMTVETTVSRSDVEYAAECITDNLFDEFDSEVFDVLGFVGKDFRQELMTFEPFLEAVKNAVARGGQEALECPYDYIDFDDIYISKEWKSLFNACETIQGVLNEAYNEGNISDCAAAIETLKRAGFKIVKA